MGLVVLFALLQNSAASAHPLRLSLCEVEYASDRQTLIVSLRLFLMDVNEALMFDPDNDTLALGRENEAAGAERLLMTYLNEYFHIKANGQSVTLNVKSKSLKGHGINTALAVLFELPQPTPIQTLEIKNAVFTDLFFDQNNIVYVHVDDDSRSLMLNKKTPIHTLTY